MAIAALLFQRKVLIPDSIQVRAESRYFLFQVSTKGGTTSDGEKPPLTDADVWRWFKSNRHWLEVHQLPPYSPEFNPTERLWQHTRKNGTHNRYFANEAELVGTLTRVFGEMQSHPELICSYLHPFC